MPYSSLTPGQQKLKFKNEANAMLLEMDKMKTSSAIEAIQNLENLLSISTIDLLNGKNSNEIAELLNVSDAYGIYTWNNQTQIWNKTTSTTELKFIFPAKKNQTANNTILSSKSVSSGIKIEIVDTSANTYYDFNTNTWVSTPQIDDEIYLPTSVDAKLTIDNQQVASFILNAKYTNGNQAPEEFGYKLILSDGYVWDNIAKKGIQNSFNSKFTYNQKNMLDFNVDSNTKIDALLNEDVQLNSYQGKGNTLVKILDNFVLFGNMDVETASNESDAFSATQVFPDYRSRDYYTKRNIYYKKQSESEATIFNKNVKLALVSKKDGTRIADVVQRSVIGSTYNTPQVWVIDSSVPTYGGYWTYNWQSSVFQTVQYYDTELYLRFNDNTEVAMNVYFSEGFDTIETKFENFIDSFNR
ncbi:hypothetical protein [Flavobacterium sp.]|uniref:hypothetical protein n=1 Tax=Flavobacterium sp. TaxID=239 RepID=UPI003750E760